MKTSQITALLIALTCAPLPAFAQTTGTRAMHAPPEPSGLPPVNAKSAKVVYDWARCTARRHREDARGLLALDYRTSEYSTALRALAARSGRCLFPGESLRFNGSVLFAGGLAEGLFEQEFGSRDMGVLATQVQGSPAIAARDEIEVTALCVARRDTRGVGRLLATKPGSEAELADIGALKSVMAGCVPAGSQARFSRWTLRPLLALALYRLARHATGSAQTSVVRAFSHA